MPGYCAAWLLIFLAAVTVVFAQTPPTTPTPGDPFHRLLDTYMDGKWDEVEAMFAGSSRDLPGIPLSEQPKVNYMRQSLSECRPDWWKRSKSGQKFAFTPNVWGRTVPATFDPAAKSSVQFSLLRGQLSLSVMWPAAVMDNPIAAGRGFSKDDLFALSVWSTLGMAEAWSAIPLEAQTNLKEDAKILLMRYLDFRSNVTDVYYATPHARRWGLWQCLVMYVGENAGNPVRTAREAVAVMFMSEVAANPAKYPSIQLPKALPAQDTEEKLAWELRLWIEKHGWTLVEDSLLREATAAFAKANGRQAHLKGQVTLANGLVVDLDPEHPGAGILSGCGMFCALSGGVARSSLDPPATRWYPFGIKGARSQRMISGPVPPSTIHDPPFTPRPPSCSSCPPW